MAKRRTSDTFTSRVRFSLTGSYFTPWIGVATILLVYMSLVAFTAFKIRASKSGHPGHWLLPFHAVRALPKNHRVAPDDLVFEPDIVASETIRFPSRLRFETKYLATAIPANNPITEDKLASFPDLGVAPSSETAPADSSAHAKGQQADSKPSTKSLLLFDLPPNAELTGKLDAEDTVLLCSDACFDGKVAAILCRGSGASISCAAAIYVDPQKIAGNTKPLTLAAVTRTVK
jgi:hypothetical protein